MISNYNIHYLKPIFVNKYYIPYSTSYGSRGVSNKDLLNDIKEWFQGQAKKFNRLYANIISQFGNEFSRSEQHDVTTIKVLVNLSLIKKIKPSPTYRIK